MVKKKKKKVPPFCFLCFVGWSKLILMVLSVYFTVTLLLLNIQLLNINNANQILPELMFLTDFVLIYVHTNF